MIEGMMLNGKRATIYPNSGPGKKTLSAGTPELGYFGTVTSDEFVTSNEIIGHTRLQITNIYEVKLWYKFFYEGRVIYFPSIGIAQTTIASLQNSKVLWDNRLEPPMVPSTLPYLNTPMYGNNITFQAKSGDRFIIRAPRATTDTHIGTTISTESEFQKLVVETFGSVGSSLGVKLLRNTTVDSNLAVAAITQASNPRFLVSRLSGGNSTPGTTRFSLNTSATDTSVVDWYPFIELINPDAAIGIQSPDVIDASNDLEADVTYINSIEALDVFYPSVVTHGVKELPTEISSQEYTDVVYKPTLMKMKDLPMETSISFEYINT